MDPQPYPSVSKRNTTLFMINFFLGTTLVTDLENVVDPEDHLCGLAGLVEHVGLDVVALGDAHGGHVPHGALVHVQAHCVLAGGVQGPQLGDQLGGVVATVLGNDGGQLTQRVGERLHGMRLLACT